MPKHCIEKGCESEVYFEPTGRCLSHEKRARASKPRRSRKKTEEAPDAEDHA